MLFQIIRVLVQQKLPNTSRFGSPRRLLRVSDCPSPAEEVLIKFSDLGPGSAICAMTSEHGCHRRLVLSRYDDSEVEIHVCDATDATRGIRC